MSDIIERLRRSGNNYAQMNQQEHDQMEAADEIEWLRAEVERLKQFETAVIDGAIVRHIYTAEHDINPRKCLNDCSVWDKMVALDPSVSKEAQYLKDTY